MARCFSIRNQRSNNINFTRFESNHTLVLLNGIAINDQSVTDGLHDFGQIFKHDSTN